MKRLPVIGLPLACTDYAGAVDWILRKAADKDRVFAVEAANTHVAALQRHDAGFRRSIESFDLVVPDGMPLVWAMNRKLGREEQLRDRVYGPTLMLETLRATRGRSEYRHFLLGGRPETLERLQENLTRDHPGVEIAGSYSPPFGPWPADEFERIRARIQESDANLIWVGLGCPKQEHWIAEHKDRLPPGVYFGIGAAFAFHAGEVSQAPAILQRNGLEWAYRISREPRRLFKRYLVHNSLFVWYSVCDQIRGH